MINRFNYTDRKPIRHRMVRITVQDGPPRRFDATFNFASVELPADARLYIEALAGGSSTVLRFAYGTVGEQTPPPDGTDLGELSGSAVHFTLKVVDERDDVGRLIGLCENIRPAAPGDTDETAGRLSILPVNVCKLGGRVWRVNFANGRPWLDVNGEIAGVNMEAVARDDDAFFALVYPEVIRQILRRVTLDEAQYAPAADDAWQTQWLRFAVHWHSDRALPPEPAKPDEPTENERELVEGWIEDVIDRFAENNGVRAKYEGAQNGEVQS